MTDAAAFDAVLDEFDRAIGLDRLRASVNDSVTPLDRDRHANLKEGVIGDGLATFLGNRRLQDSPAIVETEGQQGKGADEHGQEAAGAAYRRISPATWSA